MKNVIKTAVLITILAAGLAGCMSYKVESVDVSVDGNVTSMKAGESLQFRSYVTATGKDTTGSERVNWKVSSTASGTGPVMSGTSISYDGILTVSIDEIYPTLYVRATSVAYSNKYGYRMVQVSGPKVGSVTLTSEGNATGVAAGGTLKWNATAAGKAQNQDITFSVGSLSSGAGPVTAGTAIAADGLLTVSANETASSLYVKAVSVSDPTKTDIKEVRVMTVTSVTVTVVSGTARATRGGTLRFSAAVAGNNNPDSAVNWKVSSTADGTGVVTTGTAMAANGTLTVAATEAAATLYVIATSRINTDKSGSIAVTIPTVTSVTVTPANLQIRRGEGQALTARIEGTGNPSQEVTWKVDGVGGTPTTTITSNGVLIISTAETLTQLLVTATSVDDPTKFGNTLVTIPAIPAAITTAPATGDTSTTQPAATPSTPTTTTSDGFQLTGTVITKYVGSSRSVTIPNNVTKIGDGAFMDNANITSVTIPNSVTSIGDEAFYYCTALASVTIPSSVTSIGNKAFASCNSLTRITIPNSVRSIGNYAFSASGLTSITIPDGVTTIEYEAFSGCGKLASVTIPNSVTAIGYNAFNNCGSLASVTIPNGVTSIGWGAFGGCKSLGSVTIPNGITEIEAGTFNGCTALASVTIPDSVTRIGDNAFYNCSNLVSVTIGKSGVTTLIGKWAFAGTAKLTSVTFKGTPQLYDNESFPGGGNLLAAYVGKNAGPGTYTRSGTTNYTWTYSGR